MRSHRLVGQLGPVALAHQQAPGPLALAVVARWGEAVGQQRGGGLELSPGVALRERRGDQLGRDPAATQLALDALRAPPLELALVLGEAPRVAFVVEDARGGELRDRMLDRVRLDALALEPGPQLSDRAVARGQGTVGQLDRMVEPPPLVPSVAIVRRQAARSSGAPSRAALFPAPGASAAGSPSTAATADTSDSGPIPTAA